MLSNIALCYDWHMDARALKLKRVGLGLSQAELARLFHVTQNTISRWESGKAGIRHPMILALALEAIEARKNWIDLREAMTESRKGRDDG
jgi:transcriptional regulator with XRE-family HTH domain